MTRHQVGGMAILMLAGLLSWGILNVGSIACAAETSDRPILELRVVDERGVLVPTADADIRMRESTDFNARWQTGSRGR